MTRVATILLVCVGGLGGQYPASSGQDLRPAVLIGRVVDAATGQGVRQAIVRLSWSGATLTRVADDRGRFYFVGLATGQYDLTARRDGYFDGAFGRVRAGGESLALPVHAGEWRADIEIAMFRPATIAGVVTDEAGDPVVGVMVEALRQEFTDTGDAWRAVTPRELTDDRGEYRLTGLPPGRYLVVVPSVQATMPVASLEEVGQTGRTSRDVMSVMFLNGGPGLLTAAAANASVVMLDDGRHTLMPGATAAPPSLAGPIRLVYPTTFHPAAPSPDTAATVSVATGETRVGVNVRLSPEPSARVSGRLEGPDGPVPGLFIRLVRTGASESGLPIAATVSAPDGTFTFVGVPAGSYDLHARTPSAELTERTIVPVSGPGVATPFRARLSGTAELFGSAAVTVFESDVLDIVVPMARGGDVAGRIVFESDTELPDGFRAPALTLRLRSTTGRPADVPPVGVEPDWGFGFAGVRPGRYVVEAEGLPDGWFVSSITWFGRDVHDWPVEVAAGSSVGEVVVRLGRNPSAVEGQVFDQLRRLQPGARVIAVPAGRLPGIDPDALPHTIRSVRAGVHGSFMIDGLRPGVWHLWVFDDREDLPWRNARVMAEMAGTAAIAVTVESGRTAEVALVKR